ncbi:acyl carrier protein [Paenibacillus harenae]|uniref:Polyketide biosynthesis acyl carrier protein n=1 Tax=Paenibacillus harenae TaxID=306543 RepID=A0ABT9U7P4_PAEHA|nr:acyl carrier protein [Paenibacillus harenae]MDQ0059008.1 polyketide biosynthesis acyl carrier protein [Paenibacillus harenae]MDQ0115578.1 polyketide biosynthesis acyl carrier protein [Paenibacillus harenae]
MTEEKVFEIVKESIGEILFDLDLSLVQPQHSLKELGANSIDRMEITVRAMEMLSLKIPLVEFGKVSNIQGLVDILLTQKKAAG